MRIEEFGDLEIAVGDFAAEYVARHVYSMSIGGRSNNTRSIFKYPKTHFILRRLRAVCKELGEPFEPTPAVAAWFKKRELQYKLRLGSLMAPIPETALTPRAHQLRCYNFARHLPSCMLSVAMSGGKSKIALDLITNLRERKVLVVCPNKVLPVWPIEHAKHRTDGTPGILVPYGSAIERAQEAADFFRDNGDTGIIVVNYQMVWREPFASWAMAQSWDRIVLDEIHNIKAPGGKASVFLFRLGQRAKARIGLSGTVIADRPPDMYAQFRFLDCGIFGTSYQNWDNEYVIRNPYLPQKIDGYKNEPVMMKKFYSITYEVGDGEIDLPPETEMRRYAEFESAEMSRYKKFSKTGVLLLKDYDLVADNSLAKYGRLQQMTGGTILVRGEKAHQNREFFFSDAKAKLLAETVTEINKPFVVCYRYDADREIVMKAVEAAGHTPGEISGRRNDYVDWLAGKFSCIVVQASAAAEGVDLTRAKFVVFYSYSLSLKDFTQLKRRVRRSNQKDPVGYIYLMVKGTIDEIIVDALEGKHDVIQYLQTMNREG